LIRKIGYQSHIPRRLKTIVNKACQIDPEKRFSSAKEMRQALEKLKPKAHWYKKDDNEWVGESIDGRTELRTFINRKNKFVLERNKRKISSEERQFQEITQAQAYINLFIAENTLE
jgi:eukaryotic-like serine/threonine-protein kinase